MKLNPEKWTKKYHVHLKHVRREIADDVRDLADN